MKNTPSIQQCLSNNHWWMGYLDDSDLRIEYAKFLFDEIDSEEREIDEDVVKIYEQLYDQFTETYDYFILAFWQ